MVEQKVVDWEKNWVEMWADEWAEMLVAWMVVGLAAKSVVLRVDDLADHSDVW